MGGQRDETGDRTGDDDRRNRDGDGTTNGRQDAGDDGHDAPLPHVLCREGDFLFISTKTAASAPLLAGGVDIFNVYMDYLLPRLRRKGD